MKTRDQVRRNHSKTAPPAQSKKAETSSQSKHRAREEREIAEARSMLPFLREFKAFALSHDLTPDAFLRGMIQLDSEGLLPVDKILNRSVRVGLALHFQARDEEWAKFEAEAKKRNMTTEQLLKIVQQAARARKEGSHAK